MYSALSVISAIKPKEMRWQVIQHTSVRLEIHPNFSWKIRVEMTAWDKYVGHLESKERLRVQPAQLFKFWLMSHVVCSVECGQLPGAVRATNFSTL